MSGSNSFPHWMRQWVQHAMMWMYWWQAILLQLILDNLYKTFHSCWIVTPITHNLQNTTRIMSIILSKGIIFLIYYPNKSSSSELTYNSFIDYYKFSLVKWVKCLKLYTTIYCIFISVQYFYGQTVQTRLLS